jgi:hypothetical protein
MAATEDAMFRTAISAGVILFLSGISLFADTLVMRDGRRLRGSLVSVSRGTVVFDQERGTGGSRQVRMRLDEVDRIDLRDTREGDTYTDDSVGGLPSSRRSGNRADRRAGRAGDDADERAPRPDEVSTWGDDREIDDLGARRDDVGQRRRTIAVTASEPWTDTGLELRAGQELFFSPEGSLIWSAGHEDGPGGEAGSPQDNRRPIPARPAGGLIGRIGTGNDYFFIGTDRGPYRVRTPGRLFLGVNDDYFEDNAGGFRVTISY